MDILPQMQLEDPKLAKAWRLVELPTKILHYLTIQNRQHFGQSLGTLFTVPLLSQHFDWAANFIMLDLVLQGEYTNTKLDNIVQLFLSNCKLETDDRHVDW
eukprot:5037474-Ditylum_brightwellii.AAC.1